MGELTLFDAEYRRRQEILGRKTPRQFIKKNPQGFDYVEVGYIRRALDKAFNGDWDFDIPWEIQPADAMKSFQIVVKGVMTAGGKRRTQYGAAEAKRYKDWEKRIAESKSPFMDLGNDFKAAAADAMKKCASLFGVCADVYEPKVQAALDASPKAKAQEAQPAEPQFKPDGPDEDVSDPNAGIGTGTFQALLHAAENRGLDMASLSREAERLTGEPFLKKLTVAQHAKVMSYLATLPVTKKGTKREP